LLKAFLCALANVVVFVPLYGCIISLEFRFDFFHCPNLL